MSNKDMRLERHRFMTFSSWAGNPPVDPRVIARAGFYATGKGLEVICHWCNKKISTWELGDQAMQKHRRLNPLCSFVTNPTESDNVPMTPNTQLNATTTVNVSIDRTNSSETVGQQPAPIPVDLKNEQYRLSTFKSWPIPYIEPASLAKAGFYYLESNDRVRCAWCNIVVGQWEDGDNPFSEHQRLVPDCPKVQLGPNIEVASDGIRELGIQQIRSPKEPRYSSLDARLRTYSTWSAGNVQKAENLAEAGFYFQGIDDQVRCFHCNGGLRYWLSDDDPWYEHARWFPKCQFVQLVKGQEYIQNIHEQPPAHANACTSQAPAQNAIISLDEAMSNANVQLVLQMGLNEGRIRAVVKKRLAKTGKPFQSAEALIEHVLDRQFDEDSSIEEPAPTTLDYLAPLQRVHANASHSFTPLSSNNRSINAQPRYLGQSSMESCPPSLPPVKPAATNTNVYLDLANKSVAAPSAPVDSNLDPTQNPEKMQILLEEENRKLKDARLCKVCMDDEVGVVFLPCGHLVTCVQCAPGVSMCPLCRSTIKGFVRTFLS